MLFNDCLAHFLRNRYQARSDGIFAPYSQLNNTHSGNWSKNSKHQGWSSLAGMRFWIKCNVYWRTLIKAMSQYLFRSWLQMSNHIKFNPFWAYGFDGSLADGFLLHALIFMVAFVVEEYVLFDPVNVALLCAEGVFLRWSLFRTWSRSFFLGGSIIARRI